MQANISRVNGRIEPKKRNAILGAGGEGWKGGEFAKERERA